MRPGTRLLAATAALALLATPFAATAESIHHGGTWGGPGTPLPSARAHGYYHGGYGHYPRPNYHYPHGYYYGHGWHDDDAGAAVAAGIAGLAVGAIVGSAASSPPTYYYSGAPQRGSPAWYRYCESRYRSFDPHSGTYLGYDGHRHYCR